MADAETSCRAATVAAPGDAQAHLYLAHALLNLSRPHDALIEAERVVQIDPKLADAYVVIGGIRQDRGDTKSSRQAFRRYLELAPDGQYARDLRKLLGCCAPATPAGAPLVSAAMVWRDRPKRPAPDAAREPGPWTSATVTVVLSRRVKVGEIVTVVAMREGFSPMDLRVTSVEHQKATDTTPENWVVTAKTDLALFLSAVPDPGRSGESPFDAVVFYPRRSQARSLSKSAVGKDTPDRTGASPTTLWSALDLDADGRADFELFKYCCDRPTVATRSTGQSPCEFDCVRTFYRDGHGAWTLVDESSDE
jgi:tetratricopeptide (TPR) repeat protein